MVCCDGCDVWHHKSCIELCSADFDLLQRSHVQWMCCKCDSINVDSFSFHSYDLDSNYYSPIQDQNITLESVNSVFSPLKASSPRLSDRSGSVRTNSSKSHSESSNTSLKLPHKRNLRTININCRSIRDKASEFTAALDYLKPDIVCGTESWLSGYKPGSNPAQNAIKSSEIFPPEYIAFRNDRGTLGGGVFVLVKQDIIAVEQPQFTTSCEIEWVKVKLKGNKDLYIGSFYMPHRDVNTLKELERSLEQVTKGTNKHVILSGDCNCPDIDWSTHTVDPSATDRQAQQLLVDIALRFNLNQIHEHPTRGENLLDLVFTTSPSLAKSSVNTPGISDHDIVVTDFITKPSYVVQAPRKCFIFGKANWDGIKSELSDTTRNIEGLYEQGENVDTLWNAFKADIFKLLDKYVPSRTFKQRHSVPWMNRKLKKLTRRNHRLYRQARKTKNWGNYRVCQKECKRAFRRAEWDYTNKTIEEGLQGRQSYDFGAVIGPHSQWQKVSFFPIYHSKFPKIVKSKKSRLSVCY